MNPCAGTVVLAIALHVAAVLGSSSALAEPGRVTVRPQDTGTALVNPGMGWTMHFYSNIPENYGSKLDASDTLEDFPGLSTVYLRVPWAFLEPEEGRFNWALFDTPAQRWISKGKRVAFRVTCSENWTRFATPEWVRNAGAKGYFYDLGKGRSERGSSWDPDFEDPIFLQKLDRFLAGMGARYDGNPSVAFVDIGTYGLWGEGHTHMSSQVPTNRAFEVLKQHIDLHRKHFPNTLLCISDDVAGHDKSGRHFPETDYALSQGVTLRDDSILVQPAPRSWYHAEMAQEFWPRWPVILEHEHYGASKSRGAWGDGSLLLKAVEDYHASYMSIHWWPRIELDENRALIDRINLRLGYRLRLEEMSWPREVSIGEPFSVASVWANSGVAPCYPGGFVTVTIKDDQGGMVAVLSDETFNLRDLVPAGSDTGLSQTNQSLLMAGRIAPVTRPGEYSLFASVGLRDGTPRIALPLHEDDGQHRYRLGPITLRPSDKDAALASRREANGSFPVSIIVYGNKSIGNLKPIWRYFGADEPNYAYLKHGQRLLSELGAMARGNIYFRSHNLLTSGDGTPALKWGSTGAYSEDASGNPAYNWGILDLIFDTYLQNGVKPYAQIGFMPKPLSIKPEPYQHQWTPQAKYDEIYTGWAYPPKDYARWAELVYQWAKHCVERYGKDEVGSWYWEVWNEANIGYWRGTPEEFYKLHDYAIDAVRRAAPNGRVGGPDVAGSGGKFMRNFLEHCLHGTNYATGKVGTPLDFISFHAKGAPTTTNGHVVMGIATHLRTIEDGFRLVGSYPELKGRPVIIGESDPEGCAACQGPALAYRNGTMYSSYTAASFARKYELAAKHGVNLEGALTWAFEFEDQPYFAGFRSLASNGLDKPVLNVFRMFSKMGGERLKVESDAAVPLEIITTRGVRDRADVAAIASKELNITTVLVWHYHDADVPGTEAAVRLRLEDLSIESGDLLMQHFRIDEEHSNAFTAWKRMGSPQQPTAEQYARLELASQLTKFGTDRKIRVANRAAELTFALPRQAVDLIVLYSPETSR